MNEVEELIGRLRLLEAWKKPGGPTPKEKMPEPYPAIKAATDEIERLTKALTVSPEKLGKAIGAVFDVMEYDDPCLHETAERYARAAAIALGMRLPNA